MDLSCWKVAFCGSEPIRKRVVEQFNTRFQSLGYSPQAFLPAYGMAETTLCISAPRVFGGVTFDELQEKDLDSSNNFKFVASCGLPGLDTTVCIVDPSTKKVCNERCIGEIWVNSPSISQGYWNKPEETEAAFRAFSEDGDGPYFRTGDMGYKKNGEIYLTGRLSDLIIIRGVNYYPQDLEDLVGMSQKEFIASGSAVFSIEIECQEELIVFQEIKRTEIKKANYEVLKNGVKRTLSEEVGLNPYAVVFF
jgi:acyl-CoA synthetase (AMP-forming)/AMP-acid ligase II